MYESGAYQYIGRDADWINGKWIKEENNKITFYGNIYRIKADGVNVDNAILATGYVNGDKLIITPNKAYNADFIPSGNFEKLPSLSLFD